MRRPPIPTFLTDLDREPGALTTLIASSLALLAAGLAPRVFSPGLASIQSAVRERPEIEALLMLASIVAAGALLVGGVLGDADGRKRVMMLALGGLVATGLGGLFLSDGPVFVLGRFVDVASASIVLPLALAGVATRYEGATRATAIGLGVWRLRCGHGGSTGPADPARADRLARSRVRGRGGRRDRCLRVQPPPLA